MTRGTSPHASTWRNPTSPPPLPLPPARRCAAAPPSSSRAAASASSIGAMKDSATLDKRLRILEEILKDDVIQECKAMKPQLLKLFATIDYDILTAQIDGILVEEVVPGADCHNAEVSKSRDLQNDKSATSDVKSVLPKFSEIGLLHNDLDYPEGHSNGAEMLCAPPSVSMEICSPRFVDQRTMEGSFQLNSNASPFIPGSLGSFAHKAPEKQGGSSSKGEASGSSSDPSQHEENDMDELSVANMVFSMCPNVSTDFIDELLKANDFDINLTVDMLHELNSRDLLHDDAEATDDLPDDAEATINDLHNGQVVPGAGCHNAEVSKSRDLQNDKSATSDVKSVLPKFSEIGLLRNDLDYPEGHSNGAEMLCAPPCLLDLKISALACGCLRPPLQKHHLKGTSYHSKRRFSTGSKNLGTLLPGSSNHSKRPFPTGSKNPGTLLLELHNVIEAANISWNLVEELIQEAEKATVVENFAFISLDGSDKDILKSYVLAIVKYRIWNQLRGLCLDISPFVKSHKWLYSTPPSGTFHFVVGLNRRAVDLAFDGKQSWFKACLKDEDGSFQYRPDEGEDPYISSEKCNVLPFCGEYHKIAPEGNPGKIPLGLQNLKLAFKEAITSDGLCDTPELRTALGTFVVYFGEAPKFHDVLKACCSSLTSTEIVTLDSFDPRLGQMVRCWGKMSRILMNSMFTAIFNAHRTCLSAEKQQSGVPDIEAQKANMLRVLHTMNIPLNQEITKLKKLGVPGISTLQHVLDNICFFTSSSMVPPAPFGHYFGIPNRGQVSFQPLHAAVKEENNWITHFREKCLDILGRESKKTAVPVETKVSPNTFVMDFCRRNKTTLFSTNAWLSDVEVQKHHFGLSVVDTMVRRSNYSGLPFRLSTGMHARVLKKGAINFAIPRSALMDMAVLIKRGLKLI